MITIVVLLTIRDAEAFDLFERQAVTIMDTYGGRLNSAFRPSESASTQTPRVDEIHVLKFPHHAAFERYKADAKLVSLASLREKAIAHTSVYVATE